MPTTFDLTAARGVLITTLLVCCSGAEAAPKSKYQNGSDVLTRTFVPASGGNAAMIVWMAPRTFDFPPGEVKITKGAKFIIWSDGRWEAQAQYVNTKGRGRLDINSFMGFYYKTGHTEPLPAPVLIGKIRKLRHGARNTDFQRGANPQYRVRFNDLATSSEIDVRWTVKFDGT